MTKKNLSRFQFRYPKVLVYMLQASEYDARDYLAWHRAVKDFSRVEKRKHFTKTAKSLLLLAIAWGIYAILLAEIVALVSYREYAQAFLVFALAPYFLAYVIVIPVWLVRIFIQRPIEFFIMRHTRKILEVHKGVKIGIAGSYGKTSMREILREVLSEGKKVAAPPGSYNTPLGISKFVKTLKGDEDVLIFELGEYYPGDVRKLCEMVRPEIGFITGINEAHLQKFKTLEKTAATIFELADFLGDKPTYVNGENTLAKKHARAGHFVYDREHIGEWKVSDARTSLDGTSFVLSRGGTKLELHSSLLGTHQIGPLAAAADIALKLGLSADQVKKGIAKTKPFEHRMEPKIDASGIITLDDSYNGNPDGVKAVIDFLAALDGHRRWYVTPGLVEMGARKEEVHKQIGRELARAGIEKVILIENSVTPFIEKGLQEAKYRGDILKFTDALVAFAAIPHMTVKGDVVLLQNDWPDQYQ